MITVIFNKPNFEYDVHSLLKAFWPQEDVQMYYSCDPAELDDTNVACTHHGASDDMDKLMRESEHFFGIDYVGDKISIKWINGETLIAKDFEVDSSDRALCKNVLKIFRL